MSEARSRSEQQRHPEKKPEAKAAAHEDDVVGKAYDSRLMGRLLKYLRPYKWQAGISLTAIVLKALADILGPYLTKVAIDRYMTHDSMGHANWLGRHLSASPTAGSSCSGDASAAATDSAPGLSKLAEGFSSI